MSRLTDESVRMPDRERFDSERRRRTGVSLCRRLAKQFAMGILCSSIATAIFMFRDLKKIVLYLLGGFQIGG